MSLNLKKLFSKINLNLIIGVLALLIVLWIIMYAIPGLFLNLFNTLLGNLILLGIIMISFMNNKNLGIGLTIMFIVLYQMSHMAK